MSKPKDSWVHYNSAAVVKHADVENKEVHLTLTCGGCGVQITESGDTEKEAKQTLRKAVAIEGPPTYGPWAAVFDRRTNDGEYPYCAQCVKRLFPNLLREKRLRGQASRK